MAAYSLFNITYVAVDGQTKETVVSGTPFVVELAAAVTTVEISPLNTHTAVDGTTVNFELSAQTYDDGGDKKFTATLAGTQAELTAPFTTTWDVSETTLELTFSARTSAFIFDGETTAVLEVPTEHTHVTVDGIETAVDLPGVTTTITATGSTNVIVVAPETADTLVYEGVTVEFSAITTTLSKDEQNSYFCEGQPVANGADNSPCVVGTTSTIDHSGTALYLYEAGLTSVVSIDGITTIFIPEQIITFFKDGSTKTRYHHPKYCQKVKHCFTFIVYNDVHHHIPSVVIFSNGKINKQTKNADASGADRSWEGNIYNQREGG